MSLRKAATIKLDFSNVPTKPPPAQVIDFVYSKLGLSTEQLNRIHLKTSSTCAHVEIKDPNVALEIVEKHDGRHVIESREKTYPIAISMDDGSTIVKIHDASVNVTNTDIAQYMSNYGEVVSVAEGVWSAAFPSAGLPNGFRYVRIIVRKPIPSYVRINGETTLATYRGQQATCRKCDKAVHHGMTCVQNCKLTAQKTNIGERLNTYANVTATDNRSSETDTVLVHTATTSLLQTKSIRAASPKPGTSKQGNNTTPDKRAYSPRHRLTVSDAENENENIGHRQRSRSSSVKRIAEKKLTDFVTVESKRGRTRYSAKTTTPEGQKGRKTSF